MKKVKFLTVVWGETYIKRFCELSLPSFLATGNLPDLAEQFDLEVLIMTRENDILFFQEIFIFKKLKKLCKVSFVAIDDLIIDGIYGVTLTLAYARPIIQAGDDMVNIHFVFMNADFILAKGSLLILVKLLKEDIKVIMAPSYRANANYLEPKLRSKIGKNTRLLEIPPRELVAMALRHPHITTISKTLNQNAFSSQYPNQLFWNVDEDTVLGRYYLMFMLSLKPERIISTVNGYCDYSFVPDLCPTSKQVVIADSDDFFMLELQEKDQEKLTLQDGFQTFEQISKSLNKWTTVEHRKMSNYDVIFHSKEIPENINTFKINASKIINKINNNLNPPKLHTNHFYWNSGVDAWKARRAKVGIISLPPELGGYKSGFFIKIRSYITKEKFYFSLKKIKSNFIKLIFIGFKPSNIFSHNFKTRLFISKILNEIPHCNEASLCIVTNPYELKIFEKFNKFNLFVYDNKNIIPFKFYENIIIVYNKEYFKNFEKLFIFAMSSIKNEGRLYIICKFNKYSSNNLENFRNIIYDVCDIVGPSLVSLTYKLNGGAFSSFITLIRCKILLWLSNPGPKFFVRLIFSIPLIIFFYFLIFLINILHLIKINANLNFKTKKISSSLIVLHVKKSGSS
jgi:hypothetical protein